MSAYVVDFKTITVIAKAFVEYGVDFDDGNPKEVEIIVNFGKMVKDIGQSLLQANYDSVNYRYREDTKCPDFTPQEIEKFDEGIVYGCIRCFNYQACEVDDWEESLIKKSLNRLENKLLERLIKKAGMDTPWGYEE